MFVSWVLLGVFGPLMLLFWLISDERWTARALLLMWGFGGTLAAGVIGTTAWAARASGLSMRRVNRQVVAAMPKRLGWRQA